MFSPQSRERIPEQRRLVEYSDHPTTPEHDILVAIAHRIGWFGARFTRALLPNGKPAPTVDITPPGTSDFEAIKNTVVSVTPMGERGPEIIYGIEVPESVDIKRLDPNDLFNDVQRLRR